MRRAAAARRTDKHTNAERLRSLSGSEGSKTRGRVRAEPSLQLGAARTLGGQTDTRTDTTYHQPTSEPK